MRRTCFIIIFLLPALQLYSQITREFKVDTATYLTELIAFTGVALESTEVPDFERFLHVFDSLPYDRQLEIMEVSNLMLARKCRPRPHFILFQRVMMEFLTEGKDIHGYSDWLEGYKSFLQTDVALLRAVTQWLSLSLSLLEDNIFFSSNTITWKVSTPSYQFHFGETMTVRFEDVTVACYSGRDFIQIMGATGYIDPLTLEWNGTKGKVTWERVGMPDTEMYATLGSYRINLRKPSYSADSVLLYYPALFEGEMLGRFEDKVTLIKNINQVKFPQFISYRNSYEIDDFVPGINYRGGIAIEGANLMGMGIGGDAASLELISNDTLRVLARTHRVSMNARFIRSPHTEVTVYFGEDSVFHPDQVFTYDVEKQQMRLNKSDDFTSQGPYSNTYHNVDMNFDELFWTRGESTMKFQALQGTSIGRASFESRTFFNYDFYSRLQGMDYVHPLIQLATFSRVVRGRDFNVGPYADYIGFAEYQVRHQIMTLSKLGFVYFDDESGIITLRQKLFDYIDASNRKRDYDVIGFNSRTEGASNAELNLQTRDLTIRGIPLIFLSDSQNVRLVPKENRIIMKRNRSFQFDGMVDAGLFRFKGSNFFFQYDSFKIRLQDIDSLQLSIQTGEYNQYGEPILTRIDNAIENMTGELLIDDPDNKSGLESYPQYPTFTSRENSFIFFDSPSIQNGVYDREVFYFELDPFTIDSLDNFRPEAIAPSGTFISAGVLPPLQMAMTLRGDNSLGFYMEAPEEGVDLYGGIGKFYNDIEMSSRGLHGYGSFDYLTSTTWSDDFLMHPDSMMARSRRYLIRERKQATEFPYVENDVADIKLLPDDPVMKVDRVEKTFRVFNDSIFHAGSLALRPEGLSGSGVLALNEARLESDRLHYESRSILSDSAGVQLRGEGFDEFSFETSDVGVWVDLDARKGEFTANADYTVVELPYNLYEAKLDQVTWFMDGGKVGLSQKKPIPGNTVDIGIDSLKATGALYTSAHPQQDGLHFIAPEATYDYRSRKLHAFGVPLIEVADAYVMPDSGIVDIGYQASMDLLENARILADQFNRRHLIYNASVAVLGAKDYTGSGNYDYRDAFGNSYKVHFERIWVDTTIQSNATGKVDADDRFMLSPYFDFQGDVNLLATSPYLTFDGGTRVVHDCDIGRGWLRFTAELDPANIRIPVGEQTIDVSLNKLFAGSLITRDSTHIYSAFLSGRKDYFDANITTAHGTLIYEPERESYIIASDQKQADTTLPGHYLRLETGRCLLYGEGPVDLTVDYGQVRITSTGNATHRVDEDHFSAHVILGLDFFFSPEALQIMGSEIDSIPDLEPVDLTTHHYKLAMRDLLGNTMARNLERQLSLTGAYDEIPPSWKNTIFFNDLPLEWNQETRSFRFNGKVGIGNIGEIQVNKKVDAYIELVEKGSGDIFDIYLKVDNNTWYYIAYSPGGLQVLSSNSDFNDIVFNLKASERRVKAKLGQAQYVYSLAARRRMDLFIQRFLEFEE